MTTTNESSTDNRFYREASTQPADGGPAFSAPTGARQTGRYEFEIDHFNGMTLRDYFAAKAMSGMLADPDFPGDITDTAKIAYDFADAMLKARG